MVGSTPAFDGVAEGRRDNKYSAMIYGSCSYKLLDWSSRRGKINVRDSHQSNLGAAPDTRASQYT